MAVHKRSAAGEDALLGPATVATNQLRANPHNPRKPFDELPLKTLEESIKRVGILVPLTVYKPKGSNNYTILDGQRRWICAQRLSLREVPISHQVVVLTAMYRDSLPHHRRLIRIHRPHHIVIR